MLQKSIGQTVKFGFSALKQTGMLLAPQKNGCYHDVPSDSVWIDRDRYFKQQPAGSYLSQSAWTVPVHGDAIQVVNRDNWGQGSYDLDAPEYDAMVTNVSRTVLVGRFADCPPVLLTAHGGKQVGFVHASLACCRLNLIQKTVHAMAESYGIDTTDITAYVGPMISTENYQFNADTDQDQVDWATASHAVQMINGRPHINMQNIVQGHLNLARVGQVVFDGRCTYDDPELWSYRESGCDRDENIAWIVCQ